LLREKQSNVTAISKKIDTITVDLVQLGSQSPEIQGGQVAELIPQLLDRLIVLGDLARQIRHCLGDNGHRAEMTAELIKELSYVTK
jgi:archaellum component FlaC